MASRSAWCVVRELCLRFTRDAVQYMSGREDAWPVIRNRHHVARCAMRILVSPPPPPIAQPTFHSPQGSVSGRR